MSDHSPIEWTEATWNPIAGCSVVSPGCTNCYAMRRVAPRLAANPATPQYAGTVKASKAGPVWTGAIGIASDAVFLKPFRWRRPRMIFVNSTSDLFHPGVPDAVIDRVFAVMALCPQHTFQVLTKRPSRMREYLVGVPSFRQWKWAKAFPPGTLPLTQNEVDARLLPTAAPEHRALYGATAPTWPLPNVWLGTSVEDQQRADERLPHLLATPAALRFVSAEPLLGPVDLNRIHEEFDGGLGQSWESSLNGKRFDPWSDGDIDGMPSLDWVIVGGESGSGARPMHPAWARSLRDQCAAADVPFFFKQWGEWAPGENAVTAVPETGQDVATWYGPTWSRTGWSFERVSRRVAQEMHRDDEPDVWRVGARAASRLLDGVEHNALPSRSAPAPRGRGTTRSVVEGAPAAARPAMKRTYAEQEDEIDV